MALIDKKITNPIRYHQDNANTVIGQASTMKALFDQGSEDLRVKLNGVIDELLATTGAQQIGIDPAKGLGNTLADALTNIKDYMNLGASGISATTIGTGSGNTVQSQLEWLLLQIQNVVLNQIPDGTVTMDKLSTTLAGLVNGHTTQLAQIELELNNKSDKVIPTETVITSGFASGWSGEIRLRKNQEGLVTLHINCNKSSIIATAGEIIYTLPAELRPKDTSTFVFNASSVNYAYSKALVNLIIYNTGELFIIPASSQDLTNATTVPRIVVSYYAVS